MATARLEGQTAVVTGASSGIGEGVALGLARDGARVVVNYHSGRERAEVVVAQIEADGGQALEVGGDASEERGDPVGGTHQLRGVQGRGDVDDEVARAGGGEGWHSRERHCAGCDRHADQRGPWGDAKAREKLLKLIPYGRIGEPEDVAACAVWLASDESDYVTGSTLTVDGGMTLYPGFEDNG